MKNLKENILVLLCLVASASPFLVGDVALKRRSKHSPFAPRRIVLNYMDGSQQQDESNPSSGNHPVPEYFQSIVLRQVYPAMMDYLGEYGHPNIPLGTPEGRQCKTLRRLHVQGKLNEEEVTWLKSIGFVFHSLEEVYQDVDFHSLFERMMAYEASHPDNNFQIPKKCKEDPELGAWVTGIRRLGKEGVDPDHAQRLDAVGFAWQSTRNCGSKFMQQYREILAEVQSASEEADADGAQRLVLESKPVRKWISAQQTTFLRGDMSSARAHYMSQLLEPFLEEGQSWVDF